MRAQLHSVSEIQATGREARRVENVLRQHRPELLRDPELSEMLQTYQHRAMRAQELQSIAPGRRIELAEVDGRTPVLGWVYSKGDSPIHVNFSLLDSADSITAKRTTFHEFTHLLTPRDLKLEEGLRPALTPLFRQLGLPEEAWKDRLDTPFIEGYVEGKTIARFGRDEKVLYTNREVPFVERLEVLGQELLGVSFKSIFFSWETEEFQRQLLILAWMISQGA